MNHTPHILASVFLCGLWLPIWLLAAATNKPEWHCSMCGYYDEQQYLANPGLRQREAQAASNASIIRRQTIEDRGELSLSERLTYFLSDHRPTLTLFGILAGLIGVVVAAITFQNTYLRPEAEAKPTPTPVQARPTPTPIKPTKKK